MGVVNPARAVILGDGGDNTKKLSIITNMDGTFKIARGVYPSTTQDILTIDANGRIRQDQKPSFCAYLTSNQSFASGTYYNTTANPWTEVFDNGGCFNASNGTFTAPCNGIYMLQAQAYMSLSGTCTGQVTLYKNGSFLQFAQTVTTVSSAHLICFSGVFDLVSGDAISMRTYQNTGASQTLYGASLVNTSMSGALL